MSQSPVDDFSESTAVPYRQGWKALNRLLHEGRSFSGHEPHCAFLNTLGADEGGRFATFSAVSGLDFAEDGRAVVLTDWDFDGRLDVWLTNRTAPRVRFLHNTMSTNHRFVAIRLEGDGQHTNRDAVGARVEIWLEGDDRPIIRTLRAGDAFLSQSGAWLHFGLGDAGAIRDAVVRWPGGEPQHLGGLAPNQWYVVRQGRDEVARWEPPAERRELLASTIAAPEAGPSARTVLPAPILLPDISTHDDASPLNDRLAGATLLTLWSQTCKPCIEELKSLAENEDRLRQIPLDVVAVNLDHLQEPSAEANAILQRLEFPYRSEQGTGQFVQILDLVQRATLDLWVDLAVPTSFLIDRLGRVAVIYRGPVSTEQVIEDVRLLDASGAELRSAATPFVGRWRSAPAAQDPIRVASQLIDAALVDDGVRYLQRYAELVESSPVEAGVDDPGELHYVVAVLLQDRGEIEPAIDAYRRALRYQPEDVRILKDLAALLAKLGQIEGAAEMMAQAVQLAPDDIDGVRKLGLLRVAQRRLPEAITAFEQVVSEQPGDVAALYNLANALRSMGRWEQAIARYEQVVERNSSMVLAANNLAWIRATHPDAALRDGAVAVELATSVCEQTQHRNPSFLDTLAAAHAEAGDFARAVETINQAVLLLQEAGAPDETVQSLKDRGQLYSERQPYRDSSMSVEASR